MSRSSSVWARSAGRRCAPATWRMPDGCSSAALALWRGQALDGLDGEGFIHAEQIAPRVPPTRDDCSAGSMPTCDSAARPRSSTSWRRSLASIRWTKGIRGQLMVALYRTGNQAAALAAYRDIRRALAEELGLDPSRSLAGARGRDPSPGPVAGPCRTRRLVRRPRSRRFGRPRRHSASSSRRTPARSSASRRSGSTMRTSSSGASASCPRWSRASPSDGFLGVVGPSGSGKSSAVRAGLVPAIEAGALGDTSWVRGHPPAGRRADARARSGRVRGPRRVAAVAAAGRAGSARSPPPRCCPRARACW